MGLREDAKASWESRKKAHEQAQAQVAVALARDADVVFFGRIGDYEHCTSPIDKDLAHIECEEIEFEAARATECHSSLHEIHLFMLVYCPACGEPNRAWEIRSRADIGMVLEKPNDFNNCRCVRDLEDL